MIHRNEIIWGRKCMIVLLLYLKLFLKNNWPMPLLVPPCWLREWHRNKSFFSLAAYYDIFEFTGYWVETYLIQIDLSSEDDGRRHCCLHCRRSTSGCRWCHATTAKCASPILRTASQFTTPDSPTKLSPVEMVVLGECRRHNEMIQCSGRGVVDVTGNWLGFAYRQDATQAGVYIIFNGVK